MAQRPLPDTRPARAAWRAEFETREARAGKLRALRLAAGLSQSQLAALTPGMDQRMISLYETCKVQPRLESLQELAAALGCTLADLV